jgi:hypothetical protein
MTPSRVLRKAADIIERRGLHKGDFYALSPKTGPCCAIGGVRAACNRGRADRPYGDVGASALAALRSELRGWIGQWNDAHGRTKRQVVAKLRAVAKKLEASK